MIFLSGKDDTQSIEVSDAFTQGDDDDLLFEIDTGSCAWIGRASVERLHAHLGKLLEANALPVENYGGVSFQPVAAKSAEFDDTCGLCANRQALSCKHVAPCSENQREDGKNVYFIEVSP